MPSTLRYLFREAARRDPAFVLRKLRDRASSAGRGLVSALGRDPYACHWIEGARPGSPGTLLDAASIDSAVELAEVFRPSAKADLLALARKIAEGRFTILSHEVPDGAIDWHCDFVSGHRWPQKFHTRYRYAELIDLRRASDVKVPWELSRLQFLPVLALAHRVSGEQRFARAIAELLSSWIAANPVGHGVNWTVGMEVALRALSIVWTVELLAGTAGGEGLGELELRTLLAAHGRFLYRNPEYSDVRGNHYTACLLGLLVLGLYLREEQEAGEWLAFASRELSREISHQTYPDGVCHEGSIPYHGFVLELFLHARLLARRQGLDFGPAYDERLERMLEVTAAYVRPGLPVPVWGDADDGRVLSLDDDAIRTASLSSPGERSASARTWWRQAASPAFPPCCSSIRSSSGE
jgi:hypothetical protein